MKTTSKTKTTSKIGPSRPQIFWLPLPLKNYLLFCLTFHLDSHTATDVKPEMLSDVQPGNGIPHDKHDIRGTAHARTNRKDDVSMQSRLVQSFTYILEWGQEICTSTKHTQCWTYSALRYFLPRTSLIIAFGLSDPPNFTSCCMIMLIVNIKLMCLTCRRQLC